MSSINKAAFRIIGLFAIIASIAFLAINVSQLSKLTTPERFFYQIINLAINCIGIYGGFQLMKLRKVGHQLLTIWLLCQIFMIILVVIVLASGLFFPSETGLLIPSPIPPPLLISYYSSSFIVLIYLLASRVSKELLADDDPPHTRIVLRLLSLLSPGLARALVGNLTVGMILFYVYSGIISYTRFNGSDEWQLGSFHFSTPESWINFFGKLTVWAVFAGLDWEVVKNHEKSKPKRFTPMSNLDSSQINGG